MQSAGQPSEEAARRLAWPPLALAGHGPGALFTHTRAAGRPGPERGCMRVCRTFKTESAATMVKLADFTLKSGFPAWLQKFLAGPP